MVITYHTMHTLRKKLLTPVKIRRRSRRIKNVIFRTKLQPKKIRYAGAAIVLADTNERVKGYLQRVVKN